MSSASSSDPAQTGVPLPRRGVIAGAVAAGAVAAGAAATVATAAPAAADDLSAKQYLPKPRRYHRTTAPSDAVRHMANRFAYGYTPALGREIRKAGGPEAWFAKQLNYQKIPDRKADAFDSWFPSRHKPAKWSYEQGAKGVGYVLEAVNNHGRWALLRRVYSNRHVHEVMTEFWLNHLHVFGGADLTWLYRTSYDKLIRKHALGRFDQMLQAAITHPTMLLYLDADLSTKEAINENLGRELLELHTVGRNAGYSEAEVKDSARILTGYHVDRFHSWKVGYQPARHYTGSVRVLGFNSPNSAADGRNVLKAYLRYLAHHPATAQRIARKLAVRFVSDTPSQGLVDDLARVFQNSGTDIKKTLRALVAHPEFKRSAGKKVRTPTEDLVATLRVLGVQIKKPKRPDDAANAIFYLSRTMGQVPFGWGPPDGFPDVAGAWSSAARMMGSFHAHYVLAGGFYPRRGVSYRRDASWLPQKRIRFDQFVDHLCRVLHGRPSTSLMLGAACIAADMKPADVVTASHPLIQFKMQRLLGILLDSPQFLTR